jgi:hypothetical protein
LHEEQFACERVTHLFATTPKVQLQQLSEQQPINRSTTWHHNDLPRRRENHMANQLDKFPVKSASV